MSMGPNSDLPGSPMRMDRGEATASADGGYDMRRQEPEKPAAFAGF